MREFIQIPLIIYGLSLGILTAFALSRSNKSFDDAEIQEIDVSLELFGKKNLDAKKSVIKKMMGVSYVFYILYSLLTVFYFFPGGLTSLGFVLSIVLLLTDLIDLIQGYVTINKTDDLKKIFKTTTTSKMIAGIHFIIIAIQLGLMF